MKKNKQPLSTRMFVCFKGLSGVCCLAIGICTLMIATKMVTGSEVREVRSFVEGFSIAMFVTAILGAIIGLLFDKKVSIGQAAETLALGVIFFIIERIGMLKDKETFLIVVLIVFYIGAGILTLVHVSKFNKESGGGNSNNIIK